MMIEINRDPNAKDMLGKNAMQIAEENGHSALVKFFAKNKCVIS